MVAGLTDSQENITLIKRGENDALGNIGQQKISIIKTAG